jgi:UDP-N-acetylmuramoyl-L-alanyl-D-glutamate--2,6-diaminopimelate ligase
MQIALWQTLDQFIADLPRPILGVTGDSRQVTPGSLFVAIPGGTFDGHQFIPQAVQRGALAVVGERPDLPVPLPYLVVPDARLALAYLSAYHHRFPARRMTMIGVTGTDGKTTTTNLIYHILAAAGIRAGMISTVNAVLGERVTDTGLHVTTPDAPAVQGYLSEMVQAGLTHCVLEATSHGLAQHRVSACDFDVAVVTNITHEHLDYHGSYSAYRAAKAMLFESLSSAVRKAGQPKVAVLNADDSSFDHLRSIPADRQITYSLSGPADLTAQNLSLRPDGICFDLVTGGDSLPIRSELVGKYNVSNILAASGAALALGLSPQVIQQGVAQLQGIPGRMELIRGNQDFTVMVDFAHTPNSLQRAIEAGRDIIGPEGRIITVFGSAGLRDVAKRHAMAQTSFRYADLTMLTAEDPRTESLEAILADMAAGCAAAGGVEGETFFRLPDRLQAIYFALTKARPGDLVLICGKGHEQSMCFGDTEYPWDDREAARKALAALLGGRPPPTSGLPTAG